MTTARELWDDLTAGKLLVMRSSHTTWHSELHFAETRREPLPLHARSLLERVSAPSRTTSVLSTSTSKSTPASSSFPQSQEEAPMKQSICDVHQGKIEGEEVQITVKQGRKVSTYDLCPECLKLCPFHPNFSGARPSRPETTIEEVPPPLEPQRTGRLPYSPPKETAATTSNSIAVAPPVSPGVQVSPALQYAPADGVTSCGRPSEAEKPKAEVVVSPPVQSPPTDGVSTYKNSR